jgi:hypothetical protein
MSTSPERYLMTQEDKDAAFGRATRVLREATKKLAELRSHASNIGTRFETLGAMLTKQPENIQFDGDPPIKTDSAFRQLQPFRFEDFNSRDIANLAEQIRITTTEVERLTAEVAKY